MAESLEIFPKSMELTEDEYLGNIIRAFQPLLLKKLRVSHILCHLHIEEVKKVAASIHKKETDGNFHDAARELLEAIGKGSEPGKWRMFIDALREVKDTACLDILLEEGKHRDQQWLLESQNLIDIFSQPIIKHLRLEWLLPIMFQKDLIIKEDMEKLTALLINGKKSDANKSFLFILHRHNSEWYKIFIDILIHDEDHHDLARAILGDTEYNKWLTVEGGGHVLDNNETVAILQGDDSFTTQTDRPYRNDECSQNLASLSEKDVGDKSLPAAANLRTAARAQSYPPSGAAAMQERSSEASYGCGSCQRVLACVTEMSQEVSQLKAEVDFMKSELRDIKDLLLKALKVNSLATKTNL